MFSAWGAEVMRSELAWIWLPCLLVVLSVTLVRLTWFKGASSVNGSCD